MQPRRIARELTLLSASQLPNHPERLAEQDLQGLILAAVRTLSGEVRESLETAATELKRGNERLVDSEFRSADLRSSRAMVAEAIELTQTAVNRLGTAMELPEFIHLALREEVRDYAMRILQTLIRRREEIDQLLSDSLVDWQLSRLAQIDRSILRIATAEILFLDVPDRVAINEAVELSKRYSAEEGHRFINGVLRRVTQNLAKSASQAKAPEIP